jgi:7-cyano-7-deazaguanine synthase
MDKVVAIYSGGMDSSALAYMLADTVGELHLVSFDYGQRHRKELKSAAKLASLLAERPTGAYVRHDIVNLKSITSLLEGSALTDATVDVPDGHYEWDTARKTVVPNRNMMMLSIATAVAVARGCNAVYTGVHAGDHFVYPDCRPGFVAACNLAAVAANDSFAVPGFHIEAPFLHMEKSEIAKVGQRYGVPWHETWSCYKGTPKHCGRCPTCVERQEAFYVAGVTDPTPYQDADYWKTVTKLDDFQLTTATIIAAKDKVMVTLSDGTE